MYNHYEADKNATIEMREQIFQEVKRKALKLIEMAHKEKSLYALSDLGADLSELQKKYSLTGDGQ